MKNLSLLFFAILLISYSISAQDYKHEATLSNNIDNSYLDQVQESIYPKIQNATQTKGDITLDSITYTYEVDDYISLYVGSISYTAENRLNNIKWDEVYNGVKEKYKTTEYTYTATGKIATKYTYSYTFQWVKTDGEEFFYDQNDSLIVYKKYDYFSDDGYKIWIELKYNYDSFGNLTEEHREHWGYGMYPSYSHYKEVYSYNQNNLLETDSTFYLNDTIWNGSKAETMTYQNQVETHIYSYYTNGGWSELDKHINNYNQMNLIDSSYSYDKTDQGAWKLGVKYYNNYNLSGKILSNKYIQIKDDGSELPISKYNFLYTSNNALYETKYYKYDTLSNMWILNGVNGSILDSNENALLKYNIASDYSTGILDSVVSQVSIYDYNINTKYTLFPLIDNPIYSGEYINANANNLIEKIVDYGSSRVFDIENHYVFHYSGIPAGYQELSNDNTSNLYPNPANDHITIELEKRIDNCEINIYNVLGQIIMQEKLDGNMKYSFDISSFNSGVYFYAIVSKGKVLDSNKFIKQ